jgi:hypothetical protein
VPAATARLFRSCAYSIMQQRSGAQDLEVRAQFLSEAL